MECKFVVGQRVVCTFEETDGGLDDFGNRLPHFRGIYTVRNIVVCPCCQRIGIMLFEIVNDPKPCEPDGRLLERAFDHQGFDSVRETSIDVFTSLLSPTPKVKQDAS